MFDASQLALHLRPSWTLAAGVIVGHGLAYLALVILPGVTDWLRLALGLALLVNLLDWLGEALQWAARAPRRVEFRAPGWMLVHGDGKHRDTCLSGAPLVFAGLVILPLNGHCLVLPRDALPAEEFRALKVLLRHELPARGQP